jgi:hypothetical protein
MENVKLPMPLQGNEFKYTAGTAYLPMQRGWGIYSNNADYEVGDFVVSTSSTQTVFQDFKIAIEANNTNNLKTIRVDHCNITNTFGIYDGQDWTGGISFHSVDNAQITRNNISIQCPFSFGVSINNSKLYGIRNNTVTGNGEMQSVGIYASNSGTGDHRIYRNTLNNLDGGIYAQYNNGNPFDQFGSDGLIMNCNTLVNGCLF